MQAIKSPPSSDPTTTRYGRTGYFESRSFFSLSARITVST